MLKRRPEAPGAFPPEAQYLRLGATVPRYMGTRLLSTEVPTLYAMLTIASASSKQGGKLGDILYILKMPKHLQERVNPILF